MCHSNHRSGNLSRKKLNCSYGLSHSLWIDNPTFLLKCLRCYDSTSNIRWYFDSFLGLDWFNDSWLLLHSRRLRCLLLVDLNSVFPSRFTIWFHYSLHWPEFQLARNLVQPPASGDAQSPQWVSAPFLLWQICWHALCRPHVLQIML